MSHIVKKSLKKVTLYKNQIPTFEHKSTYNFFAFGHFMGMNIDDVENMNTYGELDSIFNDRLTIKVEGNLNMQAYYAFREETEDISSFWKTIEDNKFVIVSFVHVSKTRLSEKEIRGEIDNIINKNENIKSYTYSTFNNCDFIIFSETSDYDHAIQQLLKIDGMKLNGNMNNTLSISYSYTVLSIPEKFKERNNLKEYDENISSLNMKFMAKDLNKLTKYLDDISIKSESTEELYLFKNNQKVVLGSDDILVCLHDIQLRDYLSLFLENGPFSINSKEYVESLNSLSTHIEFENPYEKDNILQERVDKQNEIEISSQEEKDELSWINDQIFLVNNLYSQMQSKSNVSKMECLYGIMQILHNLKQFENDSINSYAYACIGYPLKMYIERIRSIITSYESFNYNVDDLYGALECMNIIMQNFANSYIHTFQRPVNVPSLYDISGKLISFYSGLTFFLTFLLRGIDRSLCQGQVTFHPNYHYAFLLDSKFHYEMSVEIVFSDQKPCDRLLLVKMPVYQLYNTKSLMITLIHEVSHVVGDELRVRRKRNDYIKDLMINAIIHKIEEALMYEPLAVIDTKGLLKELKDFVDNEIRKYLARSMVNIDFSDHSQNFINNLLQSLYFIIVVKREEIYDLFHKRYLRDFFSKNPDIQLNDKETLEKRIEFKNFADNMHKYLNSNLYIDLHSSSWDLGDTLGLIMSYFKECYADLVAIYLLEPDIKDYIVNFRFNQQGCRDIINDDIQVVLRIACIYSVFYKGKISVIDESYATLDESYATLLESVNSVIKGENNVMIGGLVQIQDVYKGLCDYLKNCLDRLQGNRNDHNKLIMKFKKIYEECERHCNGVSSIDQLYNTIDILNRDFQRYHKAALLYYFELGKNKEDLMKKHKRQDHDRIILRGDNCRYLPLNGKCYCIIDNRIVYKVYIENLEYEEKNKYNEKIVMFTDITLCDKSVTDQVLELKRLQEELETCQFSLDINDCNLK